MLSCRQMSKQEDGSGIRLDQTLWQAIAAHNFTSGPAALSFEKRLAQENHWTAAEAERVLFEYRRFVYLSQRAGHPVTPSDAVDQAWHLHLCYTRNYWDVMCGQVLNASLHHGPTLGGAAEATKYADWYTRTLESYRVHFGEEPPAEIWPPPAERFEGSDAFCRVDTSRSWVIAKPRKRDVFVGLAAVAVVAVATSGPVAWAARSDAAQSGKDVFELYLLLMIFHFALLAGGRLRLALGFSAVMLIVFLAFYPAWLWGHAALAGWGLLIWLGVTVATLVLFYRRRKRGGSSNSGSGCSSGCMTYTGGGTSGDGGGSGGDSGGSGCGGGCGGD
jgi:hypothetical protein